jgi:membrane protease YdiL (CAAX protease family)
VIVVTILALNRLSGHSLGALYLRRGKLGKSLAIGAAAFVVAAAAALPIARWWAPGEAITLARALPWMPWILLFILGNAFNEELLFRALFLRKLEPFMVRFAANVLLAIVFSLHHVGVPYGPQQVLFLAFTFGLALAWCDMMQTTDTLWGSVLFHAGTDIPVVLALFAAL